jgi:hypothetical protein
MENKTKELINELLSLLSKEQKNESLIEITESENKTIFDFLEKKGFLNIHFTVENKFYQPIPTEKEASIDLWYRDINKNWKINIFQIDRLLNANWIKK